MYHFSLKIAVVFCLSFGLSACSGCNDAQTAVVRSLEGLLWGNDKPQSKGQTAFSETEPNGSIKSANEISLSDSPLRVSGHLLHSRDRDWFKLTFDKKRWYGELQVKSKDGISASIRPCKFADERIRTKKLNTLPENRINLSENICLRIATDSDRAKYHLHSKAGTGPKHKEPNDWTTHAVSLTEESQANGIIHSGDDRDVWRLDLNKPGSIIRIVLTTKKSVPISLLYVISREPFAIPLESHLPFSSRTLKWDIQFQKRNQAKLLYLSTSTKKGKPATPWIFLTAPETTSYQLRYTELGAKNVEREPNNSQHIAQHLETSRKLEGNFYEAKDFDHYSFSETQTQTDDSPKDAPKRPERHESNEKEKEMYWRVSAKPHNETVQIGMDLTLLHFFGHLEHTNHYNHNWRCPDAEKEVFKRVQNSGSSLV